MDAGSAVCYSMGQSFFVALCICLQATSSPGFIVVRCTSHSATLHLRTATVKEAERLSPVCRHGDGRRARQIRDGTLSW